MNRQRSPKISRRSLLVAGASAAALTPSGCAYMGSQPREVDATPVVPKVDGDLVYFNWADYVHPQVLRDFQREYDVKIIESNYDSMEGMQAKLAAGNNYDIIFPSAAWVKRLSDAGQLRTFDLAAMENAASILDHYDYFADPWYDSKSRHSLPFTMYKTGIVWRKDKIGDELSGSWRDLWNEDSSGKTFLLDDRDEVLGMASLLLGLPLNTADGDDLDAIVDRLLALRPHLRGFSSDYNNLSAGDAWMHQAWSGDIASLLWGVEDPSIYGFETPTEGVPVNVDAYAIPANAEHPGTALLFIDYLLRPENVEKNLNWIGYAMPVHGTEDIYRSIISDFPECEVSAEDLERDLHFDVGSGADVRARDAAYTEIKVG